MIDVTTPFATTVYSIFCLLGLEVRYVVFLNNEPPRRRGRQEASGIRNIWQVCTSEKYLRKSNISREVNRECLWSRKVKLQPMIQHWRYLRL